MTNSTDTDTPRPRILVYGGHQATAQMVAGLLGEASCRAEVVEDWSDLASAFGTGEPVLAAIGTAPDGAGARAQCEQFFASDTAANVPFIAVPAHARQADVDACVAAGAEDCLPVREVTRLGARISGLRMRRNRRSTDPGRDSLTGATTREHMEPTIDSLTRPGSRPATVAMIDLDHFKTINDKLGHQVGDELLRGFADVVRTVIRPDDGFFRYGGDEFVLVLRDVDQRQAMTVVNRIRKQLANVSRGESWEDASVPACTLSCGVSTSGPGMTARESLRRADDALRLAKQWGRNRVVCHGQKDFLEPTADQGPPRVLVVEDDPNVLKLVSAVLGKHGFAVEGVERGDGVVDRVKQSKPDMIVLDVMLPDTDGLSLCQEIRRSDRVSDLPILFLSARAGADFRTEGLESGGDDYMEKPFRPSELAARVRSLLRRRAGNVACSFA